LKVFERNAACPSGFAMGRKAHFVPDGLFSSVEETHVPLERKPSNLKAGVSNTLLPFEN
jgi:hypothetical protein